MTPDLTATARRARCVVAITGAGISAPSGLATYRESGSAWTDRDMEKMSHASRYGNYLPVLWERLWGPLADAVASARPNPAHDALSAWQGRLRAAGGDLHVITQNIDGLHQRSGTEGVTEIHGTIARTRCLRCKTTTATPPYPGRGAAACTACGSTKTRPDVVLFGERLSAATVRQVEARIARADLLLAVGTSGVVHPVAGWPALAAAHRVPTVLFDTATRPGFTHTVRGDVSATLPDFVETVAA